MTTLLPAATVVEAVAGPDIGSCRDCRTLEGAGAAAPTAFAALDAVAAIHRAGDVVLGSPELLVEPIDATDARDVGRCLPLEPSLLLPMLLPYAGTPIDWWWWWSSLRRGLSVDTFAAAVTVCPPRVVTGIAGARLSVDAAVHRGDGAGASGND